MKDAASRPQVHDWNMRSRRLRKRIDMLVNDETMASQDETAILHPSSRMLFRFWETMRGDRAAPNRSSLDLRQIRPIVSSLFIGEFATRSGMYRWRLAGTGICELYRRELTGTDLLAGWDSFEAETIGRFLSVTIKSSQPSVMRFRLQTDRDQVIGTEMAVFPMLAADGNVHLFGGLFPFRETSSLDYSALVGFELASARQIWTENIHVETMANGDMRPARRNFQVISGGRSDH
jgi:hypothetical protein